MPTNVVDSSIKARIQRDAVGRVPSDWTIRSVAELVQEGILDRIQDGNHGESHPVSTDYVPSGVPFLMSGNIRNGRVDVVRSKFLREEQAKSLRVGHARRGDVLLTHKGNDLGRTAILHDADWAVLTPQITYYRVKERTRLLPDFLMYVFESPLFQHQFKRDSHQSTRPFVSISNQQRLYLPIPPLEEQRMIVRILGSLDDKIDLNRRMNETLEAMARAIFKSWFVDLDPVRAKMEGRQPEGLDARTAALFPASFTTASLPDGWERGNVADLAEYVNGRNFTKDASGTGKMVIRIADLNSGSGSSTVYNDVEASTDNIAFPDDILFAWSGSLDIYRWHGKEALINQHIFKVVCDRFPNWFVYYHLREAMPFFQSIASHKATTMGHIQRSHLSEAHLAIPPKALLKRAGELIEPLYRGIHAHEIQSQTLAKLRGLLLPKLLSGEIRVKDAERMIEGGM